MFKELRNSFLFILLVIILLCVGLYFLFFATLGLITRHNSQVSVPDVKGRHVKDAARTLERMGFDVDVDSSYDPQKKPFRVLSQIPDVNAVVKEGRTVFLTVNKAEPPLTPMPKLKDLSYRSATLIIKSSRLVLGDTIHKPDYAKGAVLEQLYMGRPVKPGDMVPQGSKIDLVIGDGFGNVEMNVPDVIGMPALEGIALLNGNGLTPTPLWEGPIMDSSTAVIYMQIPSPFNELNEPNRIKEGDVIDVRIRQDATEEELQRNRNPGMPVNNMNQNYDYAE